MGSAYTIVLNDIDNDKTLSVTESQFEAIADGGISDGDVITITANITDAADNNRLGNPSTNTMTVDQTSPASFQVGSVVTTGGTVVANYWNSTNTGIDITVPVASDSTLTGGSIQLKAKIDNEEYANLGSAYTIVADDLGKNKTISNTAAVFEALSSDVANGEVVTITAIIMDKAGNSTTGTASNTTITVDQALPAAFTVGTVIATENTGI